ncbi:MAG: outer rane efflux protein, partial [Massilibacillus sp.]|nr:outer rane efflux protein [Massilibacillus sp.]
PGMAAESQETMTLQQIVDTAINSNPTVVESQKRWEEKQARIPLATALSNPQFGIMKDDIPKNSLNPFDGMMTEYSLTQDVMNPDKRKAMGKMAGSDSEMAKANYKDKLIRKWPKPITKISKWKSIHLLKWLIMIYSMPINR